MTHADKRNIECYLKSKSNGKYRKRIDGEKLECEHCGSGSELEWHHRKYWSEGGTDDPENLCVLCRSCHFSMHQQKNDFRAAGRWGGLVSAFVREQRLGRDGFCEAMSQLTLFNTIEKPVQESTDKPAMEAREWNKTLCEWQTEFADCDEEYESLVYHVTTRCREALIIRSWTLAKR